MGAKAETAESERSISNNSEFCVANLELKKLFSKWSAGTLGLRITRSAQGSLKK